MEKIPVTRSDPSIRTDIGRGIPAAVSRSLKKSTNSFIQVKSRSSSASMIQNTLSVPVQNSVISEISLLLDLDEYEFPDDDDVLYDPGHIDAKLDVTALDRYNDDIRRIRKWAIDECRVLPHRGELDEDRLNKIKIIVRCLCRTAYYGTHKAQVLAEGSVILIVWLLNRKNIVANFKIHILQSFAEMMWTSPELKIALFKCRGIRVLANLLTHGIKHRSDLSKWACYTLVMCAISSVDIIQAILEIENLEQVVGEIAFYTYWINWPANFGSILQGILYGPHSVIPTEDAYDFV